jgi:tRNA threonylcarbamoyladenosine biosynthesis protein TsaE
MHVDLPDAAATEQFGRRLAAALTRTHGPALVIALRGPLGAGKTTLVRGLLRALGHAGRVRSPTYTLLEPYRLDGRQIAHVDLYRVADARELEFLGIGDQLVPGGILLVEWPERGGDRLPPGDLELQLEYAGDGRRLAVAALSPAGERLLAHLPEAPAEA